MTTASGKPAYVFRHELRLQSVFHQASLGLQAGIISLLFIFVAYQPGVENQPPVRLAGSRRWKHCCLRYSTAAGRGDPLLQTQ